MSAFEHTPADSFDPTVGADPLAVVRIVFESARRLSGDPTRPSYDELPELERVLWLFIVAALLDRLRREGTL